jgi:hypothetical protein
MAEFTDRDIPFHSQLNMKVPPTADNHVVRKRDLDNLAKSNGEYLVEGAEILATGRTGMEDFINVINSPDGTVKELYHITKADYDQLGSEYKEDPTKIFFIYDDDTEEVKGSNIDYVNGKIKALSAYSGWTILQLDDSTFQGNTKLIDHKYFVVPEDGIYTLHCNMFRITNPSPNIKYFYIFKNIDDNFNFEIGDNNELIAGSYHYNEGNPSSGFFNVIMTQYLHAGDKLCLVMRFDGTDGDLIKTTNNFGTFLFMRHEAIRGKSAYDLAVQRGYTGSIDDWLMSLGSGELMNLLAVPDYANTELANLLDISTIGSPNDSGSFEVTKSGYLKYSIGFYNDDANVQANEILLELQVNGVVIDNNGKPTATSIVMSKEVLICGLIPVCTGDIILVKFSKATGGTPKGYFRSFINYVPPKYITQVEPKIAPNFQNYMVIPDEQQKTNIISTTNVNPTTVTINKVGFVQCLSAMYYHGTDSVVSLSLTKNGINIHGQTSKASDAEYIRYDTPAYPVQPGDVLSFSYDIGNNSVDNFYANCFFMPPKFIRISNPEISENFRNFLAAPDYEAIETTNRISANNGIWTVDRDGYVQLYVTSTVDNSSAVFIINGKWVYQGVVNNSIEGFRMVVPVFKGDVISIQTSNPRTIECRYIPPRFADISASKMSSPQIYSLEEYRTDDRWIDGKPIYRRTFKGRFPETNGTDNCAITLLGGIDSLIDYKGMWQTAQDTSNLGLYFPIGVTTLLSNYTSSYPMSDLGVTDSGALVFTSRTPADRFDIRGIFRYYITVWYTKK